MLIQTIKDFTMIVSYNKKHILNGHSPINKYKKAMSSLFDKKKAWNYVSIQREAAAKRKNEFKNQLFSDAKVIFH